MIRIPCAFVFVLALLPVAAAVPVGTVTDAADDPCLHRACAPEALAPIVSPFDAPPAAPVSEEDPSPESPPSDSESSGSWSPLGSFVEAAAEEVEVTVAASWEDEPEESREEPAEEAPEEAPASEPAPERRDRTERSLLGGAFGALREVAPVDDLPLDLGGTLGLDDPLGALRPLDAPDATPPAGPAAPFTVAAANVPGDEGGPSPAVVVLTPAAAMVAAAIVAANPVATFGWERLRRFGLFALLYTRIAKERLLDHGRREELLAAIRAHPGNAVADLVEITGVPRNTVVYHLMRLEREGLVSSKREGRTRLYFAPGSPVQRAHAEALAALRHDTSRAIALEIGAKPGLDQNALCQRFGIAASLAHWHADRLVSSGIVEKRREGRHVRYYPGEAFSLVQNGA